MELNIVQADISQKLCFTSALYQWDYGQILLPTGVELPSAYEVHFAVPNTDTTISSLALGLALYYQRAAVAVTTTDYLGVALTLQDEDGSIVLNEHFDTQYEAPTE